MITDDTRKTIKFIIWVIIIAIVCYIGSVLVFFKAGSGTRNNERQIVQIANQKTPIRNVESYYHLNRGVNSYAIKGTNQRGKKTYYFIYLPNSKKAYLYPATKGKSQTAIRKTFLTNHQNVQIKNINLGWYQGKPVWEITYEQNNGDLAYTLYNFHNGKEINEVANL